MYLITEVTKWDSPKDSDYRIAPLDKGYREILLNTNRISKAKALGASSAGFYYFESDKDGLDRPGYIECNDSLSTIVATFDQTFLTRMIQLPVYRHNKTDKGTENILLKVDNLSYADRYNASPTDHSWVVYYDMSFQRRKLLTPYSLEELMVITTPEGDQQYLLYGDNFALWRKGVRDGKFVLDKALTDSGFTGTEDTDWENVTNIE